MTDAAGKVPARTLPLLFLGTAHVSLALASLFAAIWPYAVAGFFYHPWLIALVHMVTLGWISFSIVGAIYIVGPVALRMEMPARRLDYAAYACAVIGLIGMVGHFWIQQYAGMAWSAGTIAAGLMYMTARIIVRVRTARIQRAVKLHIALACVNFWLAASMGLLIATDKVWHWLPGFVVSNVFAHAHLAAIGWVAMMITGVGYRMLPMTFPAKMPDERSMYASALLLEIGVLGLFVTLLLRSAIALLFGVLIVGGMIAFGSRVAWMLRHHVSKPVGAPRVDFGRLHAAGAAVSLAIASAIGLVLLAKPSTPETLRAAAAYGVFGLVGCLAQMVTAMETRLIPTAVWFWSYAASEYQVPPPSPHAMRERWLQAIVFAGWTIGVLGLASGMWIESAALVRIGGWALFAGVVLATLDNAFVVVPVYAARLPD